MKKFLKIAGMFILTIGLLSGCAKGASDQKAGASDKGAIDKDKTYVVGLDDTFAPMGFRDDKGKLVGFDIDLATEAAKIMGIKLEFQPIDWTMKEQELDGGNIDFIWNGYSITPEREKNVLFSKPYLENKQIIVTMKNSPINSKVDLKDKILAVQGESSALEAVKKDKSFVDSLKKPPVEFATNVEAFKDVEIGRSDAIVVDEVLARHYMKQNGVDKYKVLKDHFGEEEFAVGMRKKDTALKEALDKAFDEMKKNGKYQEFYDKWFK